MVLVLHHILIAVVQFLRRGQQVFLKPDEPPPPPQPCADSLQETVYTYLLDGRLSSPRSGWAAMGWASQTCQGSPWPGWWLHWLLIPKCWSCR
ncbi:PDE2A isoform 11 [Pan troglodytes]|uniref:Phosphodiesterase 2A n=2 Tax=Homininae TaxID=207598 RepID=F5H143_HUMAN|nr:phosphodiesterase 2A [Homo sapiens]KAI4072998.1 phosphodiesterase 2A [Homo sapiens]PNI89501.1 PDE2A isoform 11 [Pan troglodytes]